MSRACDHAEAVTVYGNAQNPATGRMTFRSLGRWCPACMSPLLRTRRQAQEANPHGNR